jgi:hypothetical protein
MTTPSAARPKLRGFIGIALVFVIAYVAVILGYAETTLNAGVNHASDPEPSGIGLDFVPTGADPSLGTISGVLYITPGDDLTDDDGRLTKELSIDIMPTLGAGSTVFKPGQSIATMNVVLNAEGHVRNYPFDTLKTEVISAASVRDGSSSPWIPIPISTGASGELTGWNISLITPDSITLEGETFKTEDYYGIKVLELRRAESTISIALIVLFLMVLLAAFAVFVVVAYVRDRKKFEVGLTGWMGAMLFALIPLRNFLPGAPPLGSWIDILIVFWVQIVIMASLAWYVGRWLRTRQ